jgi:ATP-dependent Clp protease adapter protein ClpS
LGRRHGSIRPLGASVTLTDHDVRSATVTAPRQKEAETQADQQRIRRSRNDNCGDNSSSSDTWEVRLYNDEVNYEPYVASCLVKVCGVTELHAYRTMKKAQESPGWATIGLYSLEVAELYTAGMQERGVHCIKIPVQNFE